MHAPIADDRFRRTSMRLRATLGTVGLLLVPAVAGGFMLRRHGQGDPSRLFAQVISRLTRDGLDSLPSDVMYEKAARGLVKSLGDPYADLYSPAELASFSRNSLGNAYGGIGVQIEDQQGVFTVSKVFPGTPAAGRGVRLGDRHLAVAGATHTNANLEAASGRLSG